MGGHALRANISCVLRAVHSRRLFNLGYFDQAQKVYVNWDGSHDNIAYTALYSLVHFLLCAEKAGWPLRKFVVLRLPVGHTHVLLDAAFGLLSQYIYGKFSRGDARRDVLDWQQLHQCCKNAFGDRLEVFEHIQGVFDFDAFVKHYRPKSDDRGKRSVVCSVVYVCAFMNNSYTLCRRSQHALFT